MSKKMKVLLSIIGLLVVFRIFLPEIIKYYMNGYLKDKITGYTGHIEDFDLSLYRGAYQVEGFTFKKVAGKHTLPFIEIKHADISLSWKALFKRQILMDLQIDEPKIVFVDSADKKNQQLGLDNADKKETASDWQEVYKTIVPFNLESLVIRKGAIHFQNKEVKVPVDIYLKEVEIQAKNIHNSTKDKKALFSSYNVTATIQNHGKLKSKGSFNILSTPLSFDMSGEVKKLKLTELNPFFLAYGPVDITSGNFEVYMELASKDKKIAGYIKPFLDKVDVISGKEKINSLKRFGFEIGGALANLLFRDGGKEVAAKIPIEGRYDDPKIGVWEAIKSAFKHSFGIEKVEKKVDNTIDLKKVKK